MNWGTMRWGGLVCAAALAMAGAMGPVTADPKKGTGNVFTMTGEQVVPGPGEPQALGVGGVHDPDPKTGQLCWFAESLSGANDPFTLTDGHIHQAPGNEAGPVVVVLFDEPMSEFEAEQGACLTGVDPHIVREIDYHPEDFYMDLHTAAFPDGGFRGQLEGCDRVC
jgi:hypothetical protein